MEKWNFVAFLLLVLVVNTTCSAKNNTNKDTYLMQWGCSASSNRGLCLSYLRSEPRSYEAKNYTQLGEIMAGFGLAKAKEALAFVNATLAGKMKDKNIIASLVVCRSQYVSIISEHIPKAIQTIPTNLEESGRLIGHAIGAEEECKKALAENKVTKLPVIKMNADFEAIGSIVQELWALVWD